MTFSPGPSQFPFLYVLTLFLPSFIFFNDPLHRPYQVWATVKRRLCRMLLLTISLRKRRGELLGDSLGDVAPLFPPTTPDIFGGSSSRCMCSLNVRMQESISTLSSLDDIPAGWVQSCTADFYSCVKFCHFLSKSQSHQPVMYSWFCPRLDTEKLTQSFNRRTGATSYTNINPRKSQLAHTFFLFVLLCLCAFCPFRFPRSSRV